MGIRMAAGCGVLIGAMCTPSFAAEESTSAPMCSLDADQLAERMGLARALIAEGVLDWSPTTDGFRMRLNEDALAGFVRLIVLERQCCVGVGATVVLDPSGTGAQVTVTGPEQLRRELGALLAASTRPASPPAPR